MKKGEEPDVITRPDYDVQTSQEVEALMRAGSDAPTGRNWHMEPQMSRYIHAIQGAPHRVLLGLTAEEQASGVGIEALHGLLLDQDPDFNFALLYISRLLAPLLPVPRNMTPAAWVDIDDVIKKIGLYVNTAAQRAEARRQVWRYIEFASRACVDGERSVPYTDKQSGKRIDTNISAPAWSIQERQSAEQPELFPELGEVPVRVRLAASETWARLTSSPETAQYLPMGEVLGAIPGGQAAGAWARVMSLALVSFWRRHPRAALDGSLKPTRRELLDRYRPSVAPPDTVFNGKNPARGVEYWCGAIAHLVECRLIAKQGEALLSAQELRAPYSRKEWQKAFLDGRADLAPGPLLYEAIARTARQLPEKQKRGRPKKRES